MPCNAIGEGAALTSAERERLVRICVEVSAGRAPVVAATGASGTERTIALTRAARQAGAEAALVVVPFYNKPTQHGVLAHVDAVARAADLPILVHNDPARCAIDLTAETVAALASLPGVIGIVDASVDPARAEATACIAGERFLQLAGSDANAMLLNLAGGRGCVSALANVAPRLCADLQAACAANEWPRAREVQARLAVDARAVDG